MLQNAYLLAKIGPDTAENEQHLAEICRAAVAAPRPAGRLPEVHEGAAARALPAGDLGGRPSFEGRGGVLVPDRRARKSVLKRGAKSTLQTQFSQRKNTNVRLKLLMTVRHVITSLLKRNNLNDKIY